MKIASIVKDDVSRTLKAVVDGDGDIWFERHGNWYSDSTGFESEPFSELEKIYGIAKRVYEGDEITIIL